MTATQCQLLVDIFSLVFLIFVRVKLVNRITDSRQMINPANSQIHIYLQVDIERIRKPTVLLQWMGMNALIVYAWAACDIFPAVIQGFYWRSPENNLVTFFSNGSLYLSFHYKLSRNLFFVRLIFCRIGADIHLTSHWAIDATLKTFPSFSLIDTYQYINYFFIYKSLNLGSLTPQTPSTINANQLSYPTPDLPILD